MSVGHSVAQKTHKKRAAPPCLAAVDRIGRLSPSPLQCHNNSTRQPILPLRGMFLTGVILPNREGLHRVTEGSNRDLNEASLGYAAILHSVVNHDPPNRIDGHLRSLGCCVIAPLPHFDTAGRHAKQGTERHTTRSFAWH